LETEAKFLVCWTLVAQPIEVFAIVAEAVAAGARKTLVLRDVAPGRASAIVVMDAVLRGLVGLIH
jgi:hypothetical protein